MGTCASTVIVFVEVEVDVAIDQLEIVQLHGGRLRACARTRVLRRDQLVDAVGEVLRTKYCSVVALPSLTSCPFLERHLDPKGLVDGKGDVEEVEAVDSEIVDGMALRLDRVTRNVGFPR